MRVTAVCRIYVVVGRRSRAYVRRPLSRFSTSCSVRILDFGSRQRPLDYFVVLVSVRVLVHNAFIFSVSRFRVS